MWQVLGLFRTWILQGASTQVLPEDGWTKTAFPFALEGCLRRWKLWTTGIAAIAKCFGRQERVFSFVRRRGSKREALTALFLRTWKK